MKAVLINPPSKDNRKVIRNVDCCFESKGNYLYQPMDFIQLSGVFNNEDWELNIIDAVAERLADGEVFLKLDALSADIVITAVGDLTWNSDKEFLKQIKERYSFKYNFSLGISFVEDSAIHEVKELTDGVIISPWDIRPDEFLGAKTDTLSGIISTQNITRKENSKKTRKCSIGVPKHELFMNKSYRWPFSRFIKYTSIFTAWGCPNSCSYCTGRMSPFLYRGSEEILDELNYVNKLEIKEIYFADRSFGLPIDNIKKLLTGMIENQYKFSWSSYFHTNLYDEELLELMKRSGCHTLIIGIENHDVDILKKYNRNINKDRMRNFLDHAKKLKINICADFIFGLEGQTEEDIDLSVKWAIDNKVAYASFNILAPNSGTIIRDKAIKNGVISSSNRQFDSLGNESILGSDILYAEQLIKLRNRAVRRFYMRPIYLIQRILGTVSLTHLWIQFQEMLWIFFKAR